MRKEGEREGMVMWDPYLLLSSDLTNIPVLTVSIFYFYYFLDGMTDLPLGTRLNYAASAPLDYYHYHYYKRRPGDPNKTSDHVSI